MNASPDKISGAIKTSLRRCGDQLRNDAAQNAPYKTGNLRRSITLEATDRMAIVGTNLVYARIQDEGGVITPKKAKYLRFQIGGKWYTKKQVTIPKYRGVGYLTPAFEKLVRGDAEKIFIEEISNAIK